jgi:DNA-binding NtrC family response regulator
MRENQAMAVAEISPNMTLAGSPAVSPGPWRGRRLLWVDDSRLLLSLYKSVFESLGFEVLATSSTEEALRHMTAGSVDVAILDYDMPEMDGVLLAS